MRWGTRSFNLSGCDGEHATGSADACLGWCAGGARDAGACIGFPHACIGFPQMHALGGFADAHRVQYALLGAVHATMRCARMDER